MAILPAEAPVVPGTPPKPDQRRSRRGSRAGRSLRGTALALAVPAVLLGVWAALSATGALSTTLLPAPWTVAGSLWSFFAGPRTTTLPGLVAFEGSGFEAVGATSRRLAVAFAVAVAIGLPAGLAIGLSRWAARLLDPLVQGLRAIPIFAWLPLAIVWFGLGEGSARYLIVIGAVFPILITTADAVARVPRSYVETARMLGTPRSALARRVYLPAALPGVVTGLRLGITLGWMSVIVGELTGTRSGVGAMMTSAREAGRLDHVLVGMLCFAGFGIASDAAIRAAARPFVRWSSA